MHGLMQDRPLLISSLLEHARRYHADAEIVSKTCEGPILRFGYGAIFDRAKKIAQALIGQGVKPGDRVATLAWNTHRHLVCRRHERACGGAAFQHIAGDR